MNNWTDLNSFKASDWRVSEVKVVKVELMGSLEWVMRECLQMRELVSPSSSISFWTSCSNWVPALGSPPETKVS